MNKLIRCRGCGTLYDPDWKSGCAAGLCKPPTDVPATPTPTPTPKGGLVKSTQQNVWALERRVNELERRLEALERGNGYYRTST